MRIAFTEESWKDYEYWQSEDKKTVKRINELIKDIIRNRFEGIGKPEPLRGDMSGYWSRRIDQQNRLVYEIYESEIIIISCRFHYKK